MANGPNKDLGSIKCGPIPNCGLLYDTLSIQWGEYKEMDTNYAQWFSLKADYDAQTPLSEASLNACIRRLPDATAAKNFSQQELEEKQDEERNLDHEHTVTMRKFRQRIKYIIRQDICGLTVVRNEVIWRAVNVNPQLSMTALSRRGIT